MFERDELLRVIIPLCLSCITLSVGISGVTDNVYWGMVTFGIYALVIAIAATP